MRLKEKFITPFCCVVAIVLYTFIIKDFLENFSITNKLVIYSDLGMVQGFDINFSLLGFVSVFIFFYYNICSINKEFSDVVLYEIFRKNLKQHVLKNLLYILFRTVLFVIAKLAVFSIFIYNIFDILAKNPVFVIYFVIINILLLFLFSLFSFVLITNMSPIHSAIYTFLVYVILNYLTLIKIDFISNINPVDYLSIHFDDDITYKINYINTLYVVLLSVFFIVFIIHKVLKMDFIEKKGV